MCTLYEHVVTCVRVQLLASWSTTTVCKNMINPVPLAGGMQGEGEMSYDFSVGFVVEVEEDAEARVCKDDMCEFGENVIV